MGKRTDWLILNRHDDNLEIPTQNQEGGSHRFLICVVSFLFLVSNGSLDFCTFELPPEKLYTNNVKWESLGSFFSDLLILVKKLSPCFFPSLSLLHDPCALHKDPLLVRHTRTNISVGLNSCKDLSTFSAVKISKNFHFWTKPLGHQCRAGLCLAGCAVKSLNDWQPMEGSLTTCPVNVCCVRGYDSLVCPVCIIL